MTVESQECAPALAAMQQLVKFPLELSVLMANAVTLVPVDSLKVKECVDPAEENVTYKRLVQGMPVPVHPMFFR